MNIPDLNKYWGVELKRLQFDCAKMAVLMELSWTSNADDKRAKLIFSGVTTFNFQGEKLFESEVVELVSLEAKSKGESFLISGELSNYLFHIECTQFSELDG